MGLLVPLKPIEWRSISTTTALCIDKPYSGVRVGGDPHSCVVIRVYGVVNELTASVLVHIDASGETVVYVAFHYGGIGTRFYLETRYAVVVDVVAFKVALQWGW